jgi:uncharacterized membrane protein
MNVIAKTRISSIDLLRGIVMVIMALDHVRVYFHEGYFFGDPTDLETTTPVLFFTRWITHFCAPVFVFLAGTSAFLYGSKQESKSTLAKFLLTRGIWLIFVELIIVSFAWTFDPAYSVFNFGVIWAIGISMVFLSGFIYLPRIWIFSIGLFMVFGHNLLDSIKAEGTDTFSILWSFIHQQNIIPVQGGETVLLIMYPVVPWIGVMMLGYCFGYFYKKGYDPALRKKWLMRIGLGSIMLFVILRYTNFYGDPNLWSAQEDGTYTLLSFLNTSKYPPSLLFLLMTLGPAMLFLQYPHPPHPPPSRALVVFGRVPFFFYILHLYLIHALAFVGLAIQGVPMEEFVLTAERFQSGVLANYGFDLWVVYAVWILVVLFLYPVCKRYMEYKQNNKDKWWLRYL